MAEILTAHVLNNPAQLQEYLAARLTGDPGRDADVFAQLERSMPDRLPHDEIRPLYQGFLDLVGKIRIVPFESMPEDVFIHFELSRGCRTGSSKDPLPPPH